MPSLQFPSNPTSYRSTGCQIALMLLMGINYLMDDDPRHIQSSKDQRARRQPDKHRYKSGFVVGLPDERVAPNAIRDNSRPDSPCCNPPPVSRDRKEAWPYPRGPSHYNPRINTPYEKNAPKHALKPAGRSQMWDAWTRMRAVTQTPYEYVRRVDGRKKRVTFNRNVQWFVFDVDVEEDTQNDHGKDVQHIRR